MIRGLLLCLACAGTLGVSRGNLLVCEDMDPDDIHLDLSNLNIPTIQKRMLSSAKITCLNLARNQIRDIDSDAFDGLPQLHYLNLASNPLRPDQFVQTKLPNLKTLVLDRLIWNDNGYYYGGRDPENAQISPLSMPELETLSLNDYGQSYQNRILYWLKSFQMPNLTHLYLSGNMFLDGALSDIVLNMNNLTHLYLDETVINYFDRTSLPNLRYLSMDGNGIRSLGNGYNNNYEKLTIPRDMYNLEYLSLANNGITVVDSKMFETMQNLRFLNLTGNGIEHFPLEASMNLANIRNLTLDNNELTSVPRICELETLRSLSLNGNKIRSVTDTSFCNMQHLSALYLSNNELTTIDNETFGHLPALLVLDLSYNNIASLPAHWIAPNNYIAELHLDGNKFVDIESMSLKKVNGLQYVSFGHNPMGMLTIVSLMDLPNSTRIDVSRNSSSH